MQDNAGGEGVHVDGGGHVAVGCQRPCHFLVEGDENICARAVIVSAAFWSSSARLGGIEALLQAVADASGGKGGLMGLLCLQQSVYGIGSWTCNVCKGCCLLLVCRQRGRAKLCSRGEGAGAGVEVRRQSKNSPLSSP